MSGEFTLSRRQWLAGLLLSSLVAPVVVSLPISTLFLLGDPAPFWHNFPGILLAGAMSALAFVGLPALAFGSIALGAAQRAIRKRGVAASRRRILTIGAILGSATALPYAAALGSDAPPVGLFLVALGAPTGVAVAAVCLRLLRGSVS